MNNVERLFKEQMEEERFHAVVTDKFDFVDSLVDQNDLDKLNDEEGIE